MTALCSDHVRNFRFLKVTLRLPSTTTRYFRCGRTSVMMPVLCHFVGWLPVWFWSWTASPMANGFSCRVIGEERCRFASASSRLSAIVCHSRLRWGVGRWSLMGRPNRATAGDTLVPCAGVFLCVIKAFVASYVSSRPVIALVFPSNIRFVVLTAASALPLLWAKYAEDNRVRMFQSVSSLAYSDDWNGGPPSVAISLGTPNVVNHASRAPLMLLMVPLSSFATSTQPD